MLILVCAMVGLIESILSVAHYSPLAANSERLCFGSMSDLKDETEEWDGEKCASLME